MTRKGGRATRRGVNQSPTSVSSFPESLSRAFILCAGLVGADLALLDLWQTRR